MAHLEENRSGSTPELVGPLLTGRAGPRPERYVPLIISVGLLLAWEASVRLSIVSSLFFPAPSTIGRSLVDLWQAGDLIAHMGATLQRLLLGLLAGGIPGVLLGLVMGWSRPLRTIVDPFVAALHPIPKIAILPLIMLFFGIGEAPKIIVAALGSFFPMLINTMAGVRQIDPIHFEVAQSHGASARKLLQRVIWPGSLPFALTGLRLALNLSLLLVVAVEMVSARTGVGAMLWLSWELMRTEQLYAGLALIVVLGVSINVLIVYLFRVLVPWQLAQERTHTHGAPR